MGRLKDGMLQGLKFDEKTRTWYTKAWELKKDPKNKSALEEARTKLTDGDGLILFLTNGGNMIWRIEYRWQKMRRTYTIGAYTGDEGGVSLLEARETLVQVKKWLKENKDPAKEKRKGQEADTSRCITFESVAYDWYEHSTTGFTKKYRRDKIQQLKQYVFPYIGKASIDSLKGRDIMDCLRKVEDLGYYVTCHQISGVINRIFRSAVALGHCEVNVAADLGSLLKSQASVHRASLTDPEAIGNLLHAIDQVKAPLVYRLALKIMPYVFVRSLELCAAEWQEVDFDKALWIIPAARMKKRREHIVPLATQVLALLKKVQEFSHGTYIFPGAYKAGIHICPKNLLSALHRTGFPKEEICIHGFRSMASTCLNEQGFRPDVIEMQLAHVQANQVRAAYNRALYLDERREMMQKYADYLDSLKAMAEKKAQEAQGKK